MKKLRPIYDSPKATVYECDCLTAMKSMSSNSIDSIVTDPPYGLEFMGKEWDSFRGNANGFQRKNNPSDVDRNNVFGRASRTSPEYRATNCFQAYMTPIFVECLRVLKPGGHLLAFGGSRTYHRLACAVEDAGFEIRDQIMWIYGSGFPKSKNLEGDWRGWGTALKPAHEPIVLARKPLVGTVSANVSRHGTGAINIDSSRVPTNSEIVRAPQSDPTKREGIVGTDLGITNAGVDKFQAAQRASIERTNTLGCWPANVIHDGSDEVVDRFPQSSSSAARFFYCAKADKKSRLGSKHPTIKPLALMRYLCRLITPKNGTILDPFAGSGTTAQAAILEGFNVILMEKELEYCKDAIKRIESV